MHRSRPKPVPVRPTGTPPAAPPAPRPPPRPRPSSPPQAIVPELDNADREDLRAFRVDLLCLYCKAPISALCCCAQCQDES